MRKILVLTAIIATLFISSTSLVKAAYKFTENSGINDLGQKAGYTVGTVNSPEYYVGLILTILFSILGLVFLILTIYAGIKWMTAQGNTSQVEAAKDTLTRAIIGLVICLVAYGITFFVINIF